MSAVSSLLPPIEWHRTSVAVRPIPHSAEAAVRVTLLRGTDRGGKRDRFFCDLAAWDLLLEVAVSFGWKQRGTTYVAAGFPAANRPDPKEPVTRHSYQPGDARDLKCVDSVDAIAWAAALSAAQRSPHLAGMLDATLTTAAARSGLRWATVHSSPFVTLMNGFTTYAFAGAFEFARAEVS